MARENVIDLEVADAPRPRRAYQPLYRVYDESRIAVGSAIGKRWQKKFDAAVAAYESVVTAWNDAVKYYNNNQTKSIETSKGVFKRGDSTENIVYSNLNITLPTIYGKNPDISCSTVDQEDEPFCEVLQSVLNVLIRSRQHLNAKPKIKKAAGMALLTNFGVLKLDFIAKDDSTELALRELEVLSQELAKVKKQEEAEALYGRLQALETSMEVSQPSGPRLSNVRHTNLLIDPFAENDDATDAEWMMERVWLPTSFLNERYTKKDADKGRVLLYKPTHKAVFNAADGERSDGYGLVFQAFDRSASETSNPDPQEEQRAAYINMYYTECVYVWDKLTKRVFLFSKEDWTWPIWVWDDPLRIGRFFPYFVIGYMLSTGSTVCVGETAYYLDQQDEINEINRQIKRIRSSIFNFFYYNSDQMNPEEADKFFKAIRGEAKDFQGTLGVRAGEGKISDMIQAFAPPSIQFEELFAKAPILDTVNRITNTNDALRGAQFKTNTNVAAVDTYRESMRLSAGAKVDVVEDVVADMAFALAELCVMRYSQEDITRLVGKRLAADWAEMEIERFRAEYQVEIVAGSLEKPNSVFKKKEAVEICQAIGQFAQGAPGTTLKIMLKVLEKAFTEVNIKQEDWDALNQEITATMQQGISTGAQPAAGGQPQASAGAAPQAGQAQGGGQGGGQMQGQQIAEAAKRLPPEVKMRIEQMHKAGAPPQQIMQFIMQNLGQGAQAQQQAGA